MKRFPRRLIGEPQSGEWHDLVYDLDKEARHSTDTSTRSLANDAKSYFNRFKQGGKLADLEEALCLACRALHLCPHGNPDRYYLMHRVALYFHNRFEQLGELSDLEEAIIYLRSVLELLPPGHDQRGTSLHNLAACLSQHFKQLGNLADIDEAVSLGRSALDLRPPGHPNRVNSLDNVAYHLTTRYQRFGAVQDLEEAIALRRIAQEFPSSMQDVMLCNLSANLRDRFKLLGDLAELEEALTLQRAALELRPEGHPGRTVSLGHTAELLHLRFKRLADLSNLEEALALQRAALELRPGKHPRRAAALSNIASCLFTRFKINGALSDLDEALVLEQNALGLRPNGHPNRAESLGSLALYYHARFMHRSNIEDLEETFSLYSQLSEPFHTAFLKDVQCANQWIQVAEEHKHSSTILAYQTFMQLAGRYLATLPSLPQHLSQLKQLTRSTAADAFSSGLRYASPSMAIELLEQGRGIFWSQLIRLRSPLDDVRAYGEKGKELADKFMKASRSLSRGVLEDPSNTDSKSPHDRAFHLNKQLQDVVADIRKLPGLSRFLQPLSFSDLRLAAVNGPVIIVNASQYGCDAVVLLIDRRPIHIPLQITSVRVAKLSSTIRSLIRLAKFHEVPMSQFVPYLRELWDLVVFPIVGVLKKSRCLLGSRVWWCPTGEFSLIPLHAAGPYRTGDFNFSDYYISSYTPTLTALIRARQRLWMSPLPERYRFLIVGQAQASGEQKLMSVEREMSNVAKRVECSTTVTQVQDEEARIERVVEELSNTHMAHFACHGIANEKRPFESGFGLGDGLLKIEKIMQYDLENAQFAYLSACHTTVGDQDSPDEAIHLAAAMQFAGFGSVIGTMWAVDDSLTDGITSEFYEHMKDEDGNLDSSRAAEALHLTIRSLFVRGSKVPFDQRIVYVHIGP